MSMSWLATTPGNRFVMPRSSTAWGLLDALMTHSPRGQERGRWWRTYREGLAGGGRSAGSVARSLGGAAPGAHAGSEAREGGPKPSPASPAPCHDRSQGQGVVLTLIVPSMIFF